MTDAEAAWVREHVWPPALRKAYRDGPAYFQRCACQSGRCGECDAGRHERCIHGPEGHQPYPRSETTITDSKWMALNIPGGYRHPSRVVVGWGFRGSADVWLADRQCSWSCPCECRDGEPVAAQPVVVVATGASRRRVAAGQGELFDVMIK